MTEKLLFFSMNVRVLLCDLGRVKPGKFYINKVLANMGRKSSCVFVYAVQFRTMYLPSREGSDVHICSVEPDISNNNNVHCTTNKQREVLT